MVKSKDWVKYYIISCTKPFRRNSSDVQLSGWRGVGLRTETYRNFLFEVMKAILSWRKDELTALYKQYIPLN